MVESELLTLETLTKTCKTHHMMNIHEGSTGRSYVQITDTDMVSKDSQ